MGIFVCNSQGFRFVPANFRETSSVIQFAVRIRSLWCCASIWALSLAFSKALGVKQTFRKHQGNQWDCSPSFNLTCKNVFEDDTVFTEWGYIQCLVLHLPDYFVSSCNNPAFTATGKAHSYVLNCSTCYFSISVESADGPREGSKWEDKQLHITMLLFLFLYILGVTFVI